MSTTQKQANTKKSTNPIGPVIRANLDRVTNNYLKRDRDFILVVDGDEGEGKSTLAWSCCKYVDPTFNAERIAYDQHQFKELVQKSSIGQALLIDEGGWMLFSREAMTRMNKEIVKILMAIRMKNLFVVVCIPSFWKIDDYIRTHRARALFRVPCRGRVMIYGRKKLRRAYKNKVTHRWKIRGKPAKDSFKKISGPEWEEYLKKKGDFVGGILKTGKPTFREHAKETGVSIPTIYRMEKDGRIKTGLNKQGVKVVLHNEKVKGA